jgi:hypothetical protein
MKGAIRQTGEQTVKATQFSVVALLLLVGLGVGFTSAQAQTNNPPIANAGPDQTVNESSTVQLDGTGSSDPDGDPINYSWTQVQGTPVTLSDASSAQPTFTAPNQSPKAQETLKFSLTVRDTSGASSPADSVDITVQDRYAPPDCSSAQPSVSKLWPANHKFRRVSIVGVTEADPTITLSIAVTSVYQDEPTVGTAGGDAAPDAVIQPDGTVLLRAERASSGNGRVYHVGFTASDGYGGSCSSTVTVCVPITKNGSCIDGGALYDSTH